MNTYRICAMCISLACMVWLLSSCAYQQSQSTTQVQATKPTSAVSPTISPKTPLPGRSIVLNATDEAGWTPLTNAAVNSDLDTVKTLLAQGADVNMPNINGETALMLAAGRGYGPITSGNAYSIIIKELLANGAKVNLSDKNGGTALMWAASYGHTAAVRMLLDYGADTTAKDYEGKTALYWAATKGHGDIVKLLKEKEGYTDGPKSVQSTPAVKATDKSLIAALMKAALHGNTTVLQSLLDKGAKVNATDKDGMTALMNAVANGYTDAAKLLIARGADVNAKEKDSVTALMIASTAGYPSTVKLLLDRGADAGARDKHGKTALIWAVLGDRKERTAIVLLLLTTRLDVNARDENGMTALSYAAGKGPTALVKLLIDKNANVNLRDKHGVTPLIHARANNQVESAKLLLAKGGEDPLVEANTYFESFSENVKNIHECIDQLVSLLHKQDVEGKSKDWMQRVGAQMSLIEMLTIESKKLRCPRVMQKAHKQYLNAMDEYQLYVKYQRQALISKDRLSDKEMMKHLTRGIKHETDAWGKLIAAQDSLNREAKRNLSNR